MMRDFIVGARAYVEKRTEVALVSHEMVLTRLAPCSCGRVIDLPWRPVQSIVLEVVDPITGTVTAFGGAYRLDQGRVDEGRARLILNTGYYWPAGLRATITVGFETPEDVRAAVPELVNAVGLLVAHHNTIGRDLAILGTITKTIYGFDDMLAPYERVTLA